MDYVSNLPFEIFEQILNYTNGSTLFKCRIVSKIWMEFVDGNDKLWQNICKEEFEHSSQIAKRKCRDELSWYQIYRNLKKWPQYTTCQRNLKKFYHFTMHDKSHALEIDSSILPLREAKGVILYDMKKLKYIPVVLPEKNCLKLSNNNIATIVQIKSGIYVQRNIENRNFTTDIFFKSDGYVLQEMELYFCNNRDVFICDLKSKDLIPELILHCNYDIKKIQNHNGTTHLFTDCGKIVSIKNGKVITKPLECPKEWIRYIKHIRPLDDKNFICYSRTLFKIETTNYAHLYLDFPPITALFFYGDFTLIGTKAGEILLYRMESQKKGNKPVFEKLTVLPENKFAVSIDVYERSNGPIIVMATFFDLYLLEINLFPEEDSSSKRKVEHTNKISMYKRLLKLRDRVATR